MKDLPLLISEKIKERFWSNVKKSDISTGCWVWQAGIFKDNGYGQFRVIEKKMKAHRISYLLLIGSIPEDKILCHTCDNRLCVNPSHLVLSDHKYNAQDRETKNRGSRNLKSLFGSTNGAAKLDELKVKEIIELKRAGVSISTLSRKFNVSNSTIAQIMRGETWQHVQR